MNLKLWMRATTLAVFLATAGSVMAQNRNIATADEVTYANSIVSSAVDGSGNPNFLNTSANTTLTISCTTTSLIAYINGQLQICNTDRTLAVGSTPSVTQYILQKQDTTNATVQAADFLASSATPIYAKTAPTCPTSPQGIALSSTNPAFWFDQSTGLSKLCTSNAGSYAASGAIVLGSVTVDGTPKISAVSPNAFRSVSFGGSVAGILPINIASGTAAMGTSAISSGSCATVVTVSAVGVLTTDAIQVSFNGDPTAVTGYGASATSAVLTIYPYPSADNVNFKVCNSTNASITPSALTLNWRVARP